MGFLDPVDAMVQRVIENYVDSHQEEIADAFDEFRQLPYMSDPEQQGFVDPIYDANQRLQGPKNTE